MRSPMKRPTSSSDIWRASAAEPPCPAVRILLPRERAAVISLQMAWMTGRWFCSERMTSADFWIESAISWSMSKLLGMGKRFVRAERDEANS